MRYFNSFTLYFTFRLSAKVSIQLQIFPDGDVAFFPFLSSAKCPKTILCGWILACFPWAQKPNENQCIWASNLTRFFVIGLYLKPTFPGKLCSLFITHLESIMLWSSVPPHRGRTMNKRERKKLFSKSNIFSSKFAQDCVIASRAGTQKGGKACVWNRRRPNFPPNNS